MYKKTTIKRISIFLTAFILFFSFNFNVKAATGKSACIYTKNNISVKVIQDASGKYTYKYKKNNGKWKKATSTSEIKVTVKNFPTKLTVNCPQVLMKVSDSKVTIKNGACQVQNGNCTGGQAEGDNDQVRNSEVKDNQVGNCIYEGSGLTVRLSQTEKGKLKYQYKDGSSWKAISKNNNIKLTKLSSKTISSCPVNVSITKSNKKYNVNFNQTSCYTSVKCIAPKTEGNFTNKSSSSSSGTSSYTGGDINKELFKEGEETEYKSCKEILGQELIDKFQELVNIVRIMVPVLLIVFGIMDFGKAIFQSDESEMKKAQSKFIKRLIIAISFFIIPSILQILLNIAAQVWNIKDPSFCGIKF